LVDRQERQPYLCTMKQVVFFFPLTEPEKRDDHTIFRNGMHLSPSRTEFKTPSQADLQQLYGSLDEKMLLWNKLFDKCLALSKPFTTEPG
jgi:hypothetical protein